MEFDFELLRDEKKASGDKAFSLSIENVMLLVRAKKKYVVSFYFDYFAFNKYYIQLSCTIDERYGCFVNNSCTVFISFVFGLAFRKF